MESIRREYKERTEQEMKHSKLAQIMEDPGTDDEELEEMLKNMRLGKKLIGGFIFVAIIAGCIGIFGIIEGAEQIDDGIAGDIITLTKLDDLKILSTVVTSKKSFATSTITARPSPCSASRNWSPSSTWPRAKNWSSTGRASARIWRAWA